MIRRIRYRRLPTERNAASFPQGNETCARRQGAAGPLRTGWVLPLPPAEPMTSSLFELLTPSQVTLTLAADDEEAAIRAVTGLLAGHPAVVNVDRLAAEVLEREKLSPTAVGYGVAFPHARTEQVREIVIAAGRSRDGVVFQGADERVHFFFVIGTPPDRATQYLALVARLARLLKNEAVRERLMAAPDAGAFLNVLQSGG